MIPINADQIDKATAEQHPADLHLERVRQLGCDHPAVTLGGTHAWLLTYCDRCSTDGVGS